MNFDDMTDDLDALDADYPPLDDVADMLGQGFILDTPEIPFNNYLDT